MTTDLLKKALRYRWFIFWILAAGYLLVYFHRLCPAVVAVDMMQDLKVGGALTGLLGAAYFYPYALMQLPAGLLSDSWGPRRTITLFFGVAFVGSVLLGIAPTVFWAICGRFLVGLGVAMLFVPTMKILAEWFKAREFAMMTGILMAMGGIGSLSAATPLAFLSGAIGWRMAFVAVGLFTLILGLMVWIWVRDRPADMGLPTMADTTGGAEAAVALKEAVATVLKSKYFWPLSIWFFFDAAIFFSFSGLWGGPYLMHVYGFSKNQAGHILSMFAVGMIVGSPFLSWLSNNIFKGRKPVLLLSAIITVAITAALAFFTGSMTVTVLYGLCLLMGIFSSAVVVIGFTANKELFPVSMAGTATGLVNLFPFAGGAVFQPVLGYVLQRQGAENGVFATAGYAQAFWVLFICSLIALVASFFVKETMANG